jgi:hypothetical protein
MAGDRELGGWCMRPLPYPLAGANVLRVIPVYGLKFAFNDTFKSLVAGPGKKRLTTSELLWVGTLAGLFQTVLTYPLETVRTRLSLGVGQGVAYKGIVDCVRQMIRTEGLSSMYVAAPAPRRARPPLRPLAARRCRLVGSACARACARVAALHLAVWPHARVPPRPVQLQGPRSHHGIRRALHRASDDHV